MSAGGNVPFAIQFESVTGDSIPMTYMQFAGEYKVCPGFGAFGRTCPPPRRFAFGLVLVLSGVAAVVVVLALSGVVVLGASMDVGGLVMW